MMTNRKKWLIAGIALAIPGTLAFLALLVAFRFYRIPTESMEDTLLKGDHVAVLSFATPTANRGDLITFRYPPDPTKIFMKRVVAVSGDHLRIVDKKVYVNGIVAEEPFAVFKRRGPSEGGFPPDVIDLDLVDQRGIEMLRNNVVNGEVVVPADRYFVLGDNRDNSLDSRHWGFVPTNSVMGRPLIVYWSASEDTGIRWNRIFHSIH
jgi:signal peptidase I